MLVFQMRGCSSQDGFRIDNNASDDEWANIWSDSLRIFPAWGFLALCEYSLVAGWDVNAGDLTAKVLE